MAERRFFFYTFYSVGHGLEYGVVRRERVRKWTGWVNVLRLTYLLLLLGILHHLGLSIV
jgi:uncharacterized membrane protein YeiB